jgi:hypothetical protein
MGETITREVYLRFLSLAPTSILEQVGDDLLATLQNLHEDSQETEMVGVMVMMLAEEYKLRQVELERVRHGCSVFSLNDSACAR